MNFYQCWKAKFESALFSKLQSDEITVCTVMFVNISKRSFEMSIFADINSDNTPLATFIECSLLKSMIDSGHFSRWYPPIH